MQNAGIVVGMALLAFDQPQADLNGILPIFMALTQMFVVLPFLVTHLVFRKFNWYYRENCEENKSAMRTERRIFDAAVNKRDSNEFKDADSPDSGQQNPAYNADFTVATK